jgi:hypothetical protein
MEIVNPGSAGFDLSSFLGKMARVGIKSLANFGGGESAFGFLANRFPTADVSWVDTVSGWISKGFEAAKSLIGIGKITPEVVEIAPIVPVQLFPMNVSDRMILAGDFIGQSASGQELTRRTTYMSALENTALRELIGEKVFELLRKISGTNPQEAEEIIDRYFEIHWLGRIY